MTDSAAEALHDLIVGRGWPCPHEPGRDGDWFCRAMTRDGWVLAREQDARDGEALRRLREALPKAEYPDGWVIELEDDPEESVRRRLVCVTVTDAENAEQAFGSGATIAEAADAARGVLEARDA